MKNKIGFTLSEVMITLGILGVLAAIIIPAVVRVTPDTSKIMLKKAYSTTEKTVSDLINDDSNYSSTTDIIANVPEGFHHTAAEGTVLDGNKFCYLFTQDLNTISANCNTNPGTFKTSDGIAWTIYPSTFTMDATTFLSTDVLSVDVNPASKSPNCFYDTCAAGVMPDRFRFRIRYDGKMTVQPEDTVAIGILTNPTDNKK